ncbi:MAG: DUF1501 domain-containing protein [Planctomycetota bacterium]|nr:DUF1501 domain-containing protein [Planctomycetota bacterium]
MKRRDFLYGVTGGLGAVAFHSMMAAEEAGKGPLAPKAPHLPGAKAKRCILLYMAGGPSHIDTFDPKEKLSELHLKKFKRNDKFVSAMGSGQRYFVKSPFRFKKAGKAGIDMCEHWQHLAGVADELCIYRGCQGESINHPTANYHMNTGNRFGGDPAIGSWVSYGLGTENQDLPGFIVLPEVASPQGGAANWSSGFLPPHYQGTTLRAKGSPILDLHPPAGITRKHQRGNLDLLASLNQAHAARHPAHDELAARMESYELAFRMQLQVPGILDVEKEKAATREDYGLDDQRTADFGRRCLLARRLVENGVRFVQVYTAGWDSHDYIAKSHSERIRSVDKPIAALISDLRERGLLDDTLVIWTGEFGRTPDNGIRGGGQRAGRDHNNQAMPIFLAGGGVNAGSVIGATDELGEKAVDVVHPIRDLHVTLLHLLGLDDNKLTYLHGGRFKQLSQFGGKVINELLG